MGAPTPTIRAHEQAFAHQPFQTGVAGPVEVGPFAVCEGVRRAVVEDVIEIKVIPVHARHVPNADNTPASNHAD